MTSVTRSLPPDLATAVAQDHTGPAHLVEIDFPSGTIYLSDVGDLTWNGNLYVGSAVRLTGFRWDSDSNQSGRISLLNENDAATSLVLNNLLRDVGVRVYLFNILDGVASEPELMIRGAVDGATINPDESTLEVRSSRLRTEYVPRRYFTIAEGFNYLPRPGRVVGWGNEKYVLETGK